MGTLLQVLLRSLETGAIYALATLGIIIVFRTNFMINFAQGTMGMFGAFIVTVLFSKMNLPLVLSIALGIVAGIVIGFVVDFVIIRRTKKVSATGKEIITLGMMMIFLGITPMIFGVEPLRLPKLIETGDIAFLGASISLNSLFNIVFGLALTIILVCRSSENKARTCNPYDSIQRTYSQINGCADKEGNFVCMGACDGARYACGRDDCTGNIGDTKPYGQRSGQCVYRLCTWRFSDILRSGYRGIYYCDCE